MKNLDITEWVFFTMMAIGAISIAGTIAGSIYDDTQRNSCIRQTANACFATNKTAAECEQVVNITCHIGSHQDKN